MTERFRAQPVLDGLTGFQRSTVAHVMDRFFGASPTKRFLTADETGLGKSLVARGVIASLIERLQDDQSVDRIDIIYVCSNADIAEQNLRRLNVTGEDHLPFASRLTMLAKESHRLKGQAVTGLKPVNLVSFTPGTSFATGHSGGRVEERALLYELVAEALDLRGPDLRGLRVLMRYGVQPRNFQRTQESLRHHRERHGDWDPVIVRGFRQQIRAAGSNLDGTFSLRRDVRDMIARLGSRPEPRKHDHDDWKRLVGGLRGALAKAAIDSLEPDLVILDEFQRFRDLLDRDNGGDAAELAHDLFDHRDSKVLLLSATPYKPFTYAEEREVGDDHETDFLSTLRFLAHGDEAALESIRGDLGALRRAAVQGEDPAETTASLRSKLLRLMCRTERPLDGRQDMLAEPTAPADQVEPGDLVDLAAVKAVARMLEAPFSVEYWKSAPYFVNFLDGYKIGEYLREALDHPAESDRLRPLLERTRHIDRRAVERHEPIDPGNARLRRLVDDTVEQGWWQLLWMPPSLPYLEPEGPYAGIDATAMTKRLVFSSWAATPTAVATLVSHEAQRRVHAAGDERDRSARLSFRITDGRPGAMTTLALLWPNPTLAARTDPFDVARGSVGTLDTAAVMGSLAAALRPAIGPDGSAIESAAEAWHWLAAFRLPGAVPPELVDDPHQLTVALAGGLAAAGDDADEVAEEPQRLRAHIDLAIDTGAAVEPPERPVDLAETVAAIGLHGPGNVAWRALARQLGDGHTVTEAGHWSAAATIAAGFRSLFNRDDVAALLDLTYGDRTYWRAILAYCAAGNLQATLDEYVHHLAGEFGPNPFDDSTLLALAEKVRSAIAMRPAPYTAFDPFRPEEPIRFDARFAMRYGNKRQTEGDARQPAVRNAFNSPFWPFVLATTSVGQEGIDLHWWCHAAVHWNTPASPVDFDQREGRVHRYGGHAIRKNVAARHRGDMLAEGVVDPWKAGYAAAVEHREALGDLTPHWVYPGHAKVLRFTFPYPLSIDQERLQRLKDDVVLYRLALGQPRQEDLLDLLRRQGVQADPARASALRLDLSPPTNPGALT